MKTYKTRHQFYLSDDLSDKLDALTELVGVFVQHHLSSSASPRAAALRALPHSPQ